MNKQTNIIFENKKLEDEFELLKSGKFQDKQLYEFIGRAIKDIKSKPVCGVKIPKRLWPKVYIKMYNITNLWKYDLPDGWRLIYTIKENEIMILNVILEWLNHKNYERRFRY